MKKNQTGMISIKALNTFLQEKGSANNSLTLSGVLGEYERTVLPFKAKSTQRNIKATNRRFIEVAGKDCLLSEITKRLAQGFILKIFSGAEYQAALSYRILRSEFNTFIEWEYLEKNPFSFKMPKLKTKLPAYLTEEQFSQLLSFVKEPFLKNLFTVLFYTGIRAGEGVNLQLNDIDLINKVIYIRNRETFTTKSGKERMIPLNESAFDVLKDQFPKVYKINSFSYAFWRVDPKICLTVDYCSKKFKEAVRAAGLDENLHLHSLRHSFCSNLVSAGASLYMVQILAGHSSPNVTKIYSHIANASLVEAVNLLGRIKYNTKVSV